MLRRVLPQTQKQESCVFEALNHEKLENRLENEKEYQMEGEALVTRRALSVQVKENGIDQQHGNIFHTGYPC